MSTHFKLLMIISAFLKPSGLSLLSGIAMQYIPALFAEITPFMESSITTHSSHSNPRLSAV